MADTFTTNLNLTKPEPGASEDTWGISLNADLDALDAIFSSSGTQINLNPNQINFADNKKAIFGTDNDLQIYHDSSTSYILDDGVGDLQLRSNNRIVIAKSPFEYMADFNVDGAVDLYYDNSKKLATTSTGIDVTGTATMDGLTVDTTTLVVDASNNRVGIGTTSPTGKIHVKSGSTPSIAQLIIGYNNTSINYFDANTHIFRNGSSQEKMRLTSAGKLGLGTSSPDAPLTVHSSSDPEIRLGYSSTQDHRITWDSAKLFIDADPDNGVGNSALGFRVDGSEAGRFDSSGNFLVGTTNSSLSNSSSPSITGINLKPNGASAIARDGGTVLYLNRISSDGDITQFRKDGTTVGSVSVTSSATTYNTSSDARLKDITGEARGLKVINELNPVAYNWKADGKADEGLIAQEVLDIVPNAVSQNEEEMYQMDYSKLVVHLVAGMKEQQTQIEALQSEINLLKGE